MRDLSRVTAALLDAYHRGATIPPVSAGDPGFSVGQAYDVLRAIEHRRRSDGWTPAGRKIGFTNTTIWERYGVDRPMWARMWSRTVRTAPDGRADLALGSFVQPRTEPEVVFKLRGAVPVTDEPRVVLDSVEWIAAGFEIVQCHFPSWRFTAADCTADFGSRQGTVTRCAMRWEPLP
jgi:2-keto-4-pentenoate hydratase